MQGQQAGFREARTVTHRDVLASPEHVLYHHGMIDASEAYDGKNTGYEKELRPGTPLGQITASKQWVPCRRSAANGAGSSATALIVDDARTFKAGDDIAIGATSGTISSVNYGTETITLTAAKTWSDGDAVYVNDGSQTARCILNQHINLYTPDRVLVDRSFGNGIYHGLVKSAEILGDLTAIRAATNSLSHIIWDDQQGML